MLWSDKYSVVLKKTSPHRATYFKKYLVKLRKKVYISEILSYLYNILRRTRVLTIQQLDEIIYINNTVFILSTPTKQRYYNIANEAIAFHISLSTGVLIKDNLKRSKFFKKQLKNIQPVILLLEQYYKNILLAPTLFIVKNFTKEHFIFLSLFFKIRITTVGGLFFKKSYNCITKGRGRIKKKVFKQLVAEHSMVGIKFNVLSITMVAVYLHLEGLLYLFIRRG